MAEGYCEKCCGNSIDRKFDHKFLRMTLFLRWFLCRHSRALSNLIILLDSRYIYTRKIYFSWMFLRAGKFSNNLSSKLAVR